jgi:hypothetical protein
LSQRDLAERLRKPPSYVHKCEVADRRIDPIELIAWAKACGLSGVDAIRTIETETTAVAPKPTSRRAARGK